MEYSSSQDYPNSFNAGTLISFRLEETSAWRVAISDVLGQIVRRLEGHGTAGQVTVLWDGISESGESVSSGIYFCRPQAGTWSDTKKMLLLR